MAGKDDLEYPYEASDEASESELLDRSLSVWSGPSSFGGDDFTPVALDLHTASSIGHYGCVRSIIEKREEDLNEKNLGGWTALMYASYIGYDTVVNLLLEAGVAVNTKNNKGMTSLMLAACCGNESVAYFLLQQGAEIEATDNRGWTALFHATFSGHQNMVKFLLDNEANMDAVSQGSVTANVTELLACAAKCMIKLDLVNRDSVRGMTPFMEAAAAGHEIIVQYFLQHGVNVNLKNCSGDTARSLALMKGHRKIVSLIDNHVMGSFLPVRMSDQGSNYSVEYLSSSDEAFPSGAKRPASRRMKQTKAKGVSIQDGPEAFEVLMDRANMAVSAKKRNLTVKRPPNNTIVPQGYVAFANSVPDLEIDDNFRYRDVTSPINIEDHKLDSSGGKDSLDNDEDCNVFTQTGALTIRSSSSSSSGLAAALKICQEVGSDGLADADTDQNSAKLDFNETKVKADLQCGESDAPNVSQPTSFCSPQRTAVTRGHSETTECIANNAGTIGLGVDRDTVVSLNPKTLTSRAYTEQRQMLQQRPQTLAEVLQELNLLKYLAIFEEQDVDLQVFLTLTDNDLHEIGIKLFGPRKKMNVAIARWHSNARPSGNDLEQAYADKLETEMQEMAIQLHQAHNLVEQMRHQLALEQELRSVTEACLMEDRATSQHICQLSADSLQRCVTTRELLTTACLYTEELGHCLGHENDFRGGKTASATGSNHEISHKDAKSTTQCSIIPDEACKLSNQQLLCKVQNCHEELSRTSALILMNTESILKKQFKTIKSAFPGAPIR